MQRKQKMFIYPTIRKAGKRHDQVALDRVKRLSSTTYFILSQYGTSKIRNSFQNQLCFQAYTQEIFINVRSSFDMPDT